jgi:hypothetical protein
MGSLSNLYISQSYISLIHLGSDTAITTASVELQDGLGNGIGVFVNSLGDVQIEGQLSASNIPADIATQAELNAYTASTNSRLNNIELTTASLNISVSNLNSFTSSQNTKNTTLATYTASVDTKFDAVGYSTASLNAFTASQQSFNASATASIQQLLAFSSSLDTGYVTQAELAAATGSLINQIDTKLNTSSFNSYTASNDSIVGALVSATASYAISSSVAAVDYGQQQQIDSLIAVTASFLTSSTDISSLNAFTASQETKNSTLASVTASIDISLSNINQFTSSQETKNSTLASYTASVDSSLTNLNSFTASQSNVNIVFAGEIGSLEAATASLFNSASLALVTASFDNGTRNLTFTKGDTTQFSVNIPDVSGSSGDFVTTASFNAYTASTDSIINSLVSATSSYAISSSVAAIDNAQQAQIDSLIAWTGSVTASVDTGSLLENAAANGTNTIQFTRGDGSQFDVVMSVSSSAGVPGNSYNSIFSGSTWNVPHNLNTYTPLVFAYESGSQYTLPASLTIDDSNNITLVWSRVVNGTVVVVNGGDPTYYGDISNSATASITHNLNTLYPMVQFYESGSNAQAIPGAIIGTDANTVTLQFSTAVSGKVVIKK